MNEIRFIILILCVILFFSSFCFAMEVVCDKYSNCFLQVPNSEITLIWEHSCMGHIEVGEFERARQNKRAIEWQRANKNGISMLPSDLAAVQQKLKDAQIARETAGDLWGCNPPDAKLELLSLHVGQNGISKLAESYITNTEDSIEVKAEARLIGPECDDPQLKWSIVIPKNNITKSFGNQLTVEHVQAVPAAPRGDRGMDLTVEVNVELFCAGTAADRLTYAVEQDMKDQLRQEYLDMGKKMIPERSELISSKRTKNFTIEEFNYSERVTGGKYDYILCKILDKLEAVREKTGGVKMIINSGFRNPYKNAKQSGAGRESMHIYGFAADIALSDFDGDGKRDKDDWEVMAIAARSNGACIEPRAKAQTWIHMDWRGICPIGW